MVSDGTNGLIDDEDFDHVGQWMNAPLDHAVQWGIHPLSTDPSYQTPRADPPFPVGPPYLLNQPFILYTQLCLVESITLAFHYYETRIGNNKIVFFLEI